MRVLLHESHNAVYRPSSSSVQVLRNGEAIILMVDSPLEHDS